MKKVLNLKIAWLRRVCICLFCAALLCTSLMPVKISASDASSLENTEGTGAPRYTNASIENWYRHDPSRAVFHSNLKGATSNGENATSENGAVRLPEGGELAIPLDIPKDGEYKLVFRYRPVNPRVLDYVFQVKLVEADSADPTAFEVVAALPVLWADGTDSYGTDRYGNELIPNQVAVDSFYNGVLEDYHSPNKDIVCFRLKSGRYILKLTGGDYDLLISDIYGYVFEETGNDGLTAPNGNNPAAGEQIIIEAEKYAVKSNSFIRAKNERNPALYPYETYRKVLNTLDGGSWSTVGQKVLWEFKVEQDGYYQISFRYNQNSDAGKPVYRTIEIDGEVPEDIFQNFAFPRTGNSKYKNITVQKSGNPAWVYLEKGVHTISMSVTMGGMGSAYEKLLELMNRVNELGTAMHKLTAGQNDQNRTWDMSVYLPNAVSDLEKIADEIDQLYNQLQELCGGKPVFADELLYASEIIRKLIKKPSVLPNQTKLIHMGDSSVNKYLGLVLSKLINQPLSIDRIYIHSGEESLPGSKVNVFKSMWETIKSFAYSFLPDSGNSNYSSIGKAKSDELTVWVNRPIQYVEVMQQLIDSKYNTTREKSVKLSIMPNSQKLILACSAGTNPDLVMGIPYHMPFDFAVRGAAKNLLDYQDFLEFYNSEYQLESLVPLCYGEGVYGAVETINFQVMIYRRDILDSLGLEVPNTWDDVKRMMPTLLRNSMNFYIPLSSSSGFKTFGMTSPFINQNGGRYYAPDGLSTAIDMYASMKGLTEMVELYNIFGMKQTVANFYNSFRFGEVPIGIADFNTYIKLKMAAPELERLWDIAPTPGTLAEDGTILRYQTADNTACMIFNETLNESESWDFLKWWLSKDTQVDYAYSMLQGYGPLYTWNTANIKAFSELSYSAEHKEIILEQLKSQKENIRHPANYMVEREVSNIWTNVVVNGDGLAESVDKATINSNREIIKKMNEFGFCDKNGNVLKVYTTDVLAMLNNRLSEGRKKS